MAHDLTLPSLHCSQTPLLLVPSSPLRDEVKMQYVHKTPVSACLANRIISLCANMSTINSYIIAFHFGFEHTLDIC